MLACAACAAPAPSPPRQLPAPVPRTVVHAPAPAILSLGSACSDDHPCRGDRACTPWPGGYCTAACEGCEGACVVVPHSGPLCVAGCMADAQCRVAEGYTCDDDWHACLIPNTAAIVPRACPDRGGRDPSMSPVGKLLLGHDPAAAIANDGTPIVVVATGGELHGPGFAVRGDHPSLSRDARGTLYATWCAAFAHVASSRDGGATSVS